MISSAAFLFILFSVGVVSFVVGLRLGGRSQPSSPLSEEEQVAAAFGVLKRHFEKRALADMEASGARLWSPDPALVAELSHGSRLDAPVLVGRNGKVDPEPRDHR